MRKNMMKKAVATFMLLAMVAGLTACSSSTTEEATEVATEAATEAATEEAAEEVAEATGDWAWEDLTIGFAQSGNPNPWMVALTESMQETADAYGVNYIYTDANDDMATHVANIEDMLTQGLDILVVAPMEDTGLESVLEKAAEQGIPVILSGRTTTGEYLTTVYSDQAWEGERCAEIIGEWKADAKVVELRGTEGTSSVAGREAGFRDIMESEYPEMEIVAEQTANFDRSEGMDVMTNLIQSIGADGIDAVYCHNDEMAIGAVQAIIDAGLVPGEDIVVVGIDGQYEAWELVISGEMLATVQCSPMHGPTVFEVIESYLNGETIEIETIVPDAIITQDNAAECEDLVF